VRWSRWRTWDPDELIVRKAIPPVVVWLERPDQRVVAVVGPASSRVAVRRVVAAADVTAMHAEAKVIPLTTIAQTVFTSVR
jgi:hypothetical protein